MIKVFIAIFLFTALICWLWVRGIVNMKKNHPNYKGQDFLAEDDEYEN
jgi:hypothetical protein